MDIIGHLNRTVTPAVLGDNHDKQSEGLLQQFYALFAGKLADEDSYNQIGTQEVHRDDLGLFDRLWSDDKKKSSFIRELGRANKVEEGSVKGLLASAAPLAFNEIKSLAGSTPIPQFLRNNLSSFKDHIPAWAAMSGLVPAGLLAANKASANTAATTATTETVATPVATETAHVEPAHVEKEGHRISDTTSTAPLHHEEKESGGFMKALLPIIGLIILGILAWLFLRGCQDTNEPVAAPVENVEQTATSDTGAVAASAMPATLSLATGEGNELFACRISAGNDDLNSTITSAVNDVFGGEADKCRTDIDDDFATDMPAAQYLPAILPILKSSPNANMVIEGDEIRVNSPDDADLQRLVSDLQAAAPEMNVIAEGPLDIEGEIDQSITDANAAMDNLGDNPDPRDLARALSLQVINFEVDKAIIPDVNKPLLDRAATMLEAMPDAELLILGHTDSQASDSYNMDLSQRRAQAVKDYLVEQGVPAEKLLTKGMGEADPIATNETEQGRFRNRRIEFTVYDESVHGNLDDASGIEVTPDTEIASDATDTDATDLDADFDPDLNPLDDNNDDLTRDSDDPALPVAEEK